MVQAVTGGEPVSAVAGRFGVDRKTVRKWLQRFRVEGLLAWPTAARGRSVRPPRSRGARPNE